jgi:hypothetical protein
LGKIEFNELSFESEHDRNRYVFLNRDRIAVVDQKELNKKPPDGAEAFVGCTGMFFGFWVGALISIVVFFAVSGIGGGNPYGCLLVPVICSVSVLWFHNYFVRKERKKTRKEQSATPRDQESFPTQANIEKYYEQYQRFLESSETDQVKDILDGFIRRYQDRDQQKDHYWAVANSIMLKTHLSVSGEDIEVLARRHEQRTKIELVKKVLEDVKSELTKFEDKTLANIAAAFIKVVYGDYPDWLFGEDDIYPGYVKYLAERGISVSIPELDAEVVRQHCFQITKDIEDKLKAINTDERTLEPIIDDPDPKGFEDLISHVFEKAGYTTRFAIRTRDPRFDLIIEKDGITTVVQLKNLRGSVGDQAIPEAMAAKESLHCDMAMVLTTGEFTEGARSSAKKDFVYLVDKKALLELIKSVS